MAGGPDFESVVSEEEVKVFFHNHALLELALGKVAQHEFLAAQTDGTYQTNDQMLVAVTFRHGAAACGQKCHPQPLPAMVVLPQQW